jgi:hypothetical protein
LSKAIHTACVVRSGGKEHEHIAPHERVKPLDARQDKT